MKIQLDFNNIKVKEQKKDFTVKILMLKGEKGDTGDLDQSKIVDNLTSTDNTKVLSAKQGKILKDLVDKKPYYFDTVADMKAGNLSAGDMAITKGYYSVNDGGGAKYLIRIKTNSDVEDNGSIHFIGTQLVAELLSNEITPKMFGAIDSNSVDQATYIQNCLNYCFDKKIKEVNLNGEYFINTKLNFQNKTNLVINNGTFYVNETTALLSTDFNVLSFTNCENIIVDNIKIIELSPSARSRKLYAGGIYFNSCNKCIIQNCYIENTQSGIILYNNCNECEVLNNVINVNYHSQQFAESGILNYSSNKTIIRNNKISGEFYDGTLSIYGGGAVEVIVDGNILNNLFDDSPIYLSEGITIDASTDNVVVSNNIVHNMYYGIDVKHDARNTLVVNNVLIGNKISIADRPGEEVLQTLNTQIKNNQIIIRKNFDTDTLGNILIEGFYYIGIFASQRLSSDIKNNKITCYGDLDDLTVCGIKCEASSTNTTNQYLSQFDISNNSIEFATGFGSIVSNAGSKSVGIGLKNIKKGIISANSFKVDVSSNDYAMIKLFGDNSNLFITNNLCFGTSDLNHNFLIKNSGSTITQSSIYDNKFRNAKQMLNLEDVSNEIDTSRFNIRCHQIAPINLVADTWTTVAKITLKYAGIVHFKLKGIIIATGTRYINAEYDVRVNGTTTTPSEINNGSDGFSIQIVNDGTQNSASIQIKTPQGVSINDFGNLIIYEIMSDQNVTLTNN